MIREERKEEKKIIIISGEGKGEQKAESEEMGSDGPRDRLTVGRSAVVLWDRKTVSPMTH